MKKRIIRGAACLLAVLSLCLCACSSVPTMKYQNGEYVLSKTAYRPAPTTYVARTLLEEEKVARIKQKGMEEEILLYAVENMDRSVWLANENYEVFVAVGTQLPEVWEMNVNEAFLTKTAKVTYVLDTIRDEGTIQKLIGAYRYGPCFSDDELEPGLVPDKYEIRFVSRAPVGLLYCLVYWQFEKEVLVYDVMENKETYTPVYEGIPYTVEENLYTENGVEKTETLAVYHFGKGLLYNRETGLCYPVGTLISDRLSGN